MDSPRAVDDRADGASHAVALGRALATHCLECSTVEPEASRVSATHGAVYQYTGPGVVTGAGGFSGGGSDGGVQAPVPCVGAYTKWLENSEVSWTWEVVVLETTIVASPLVRL